jgi:uncharacterized protein YggE
MNQQFADNIHRDWTPVSSVHDSQSVFFGVYRAAFSVFVGALVLSAFPASRCFADQNAGIVVEGHGEVKTVPDVVEINLKLAAKGELTDDAVVKHRDSKKRAIDTFKALKLENLELEEKELGLKAGGNAQEMMQMMWGGMPPAANKRTQVEVGSTLRARLTGVDKLPIEELMSSVGKLLDAAQDSGASLGMSDTEAMMMRWNWGWAPNSSLVKFVVTNVKEMREKAYELAVADARKRAERLARLSGVKLGSVLAIDELMHESGNRNFYNPWMMDQKEGKDDDHGKEEIVAETMSGGKLKVGLRVRFAIIPIPNDQDQTVAAEAKK